MTERQRRVPARKAKAAKNATEDHHYRLFIMPGRPKESLRQHGAIVKAVVAGDEDGAAEAMELRLESVIEVLNRWGDAPASS